MWDRAAAVAQLAQLAAEGEERGFLAGADLAAQALHLHSAAAQRWLRHCDHLMREVQVGSD